MPVPSHVDGLQAGQAQERVEQAEVDVGEEDPDEPCDDARHEHREVDQEPIGGRTAAHPGQEQRDAEGDDQRGGDGQDREPEGVADGRHRAHLARQPEVVVEAHELGVRGHAALLGAPPEHARAPAAAGTGRRTRTGAAGMPSRSAPARRDAGGAAGDAPAADSRARRAGGATGSDRGRTCSTYGVRKLVQDRGPVPGQRPRASLTMSSMFFTASAAEMFPA